MSNPKPVEPRKNQSDEQPLPASTSADEHTDYENPNKKHGLGHGFGIRMFRAIEVALALAGVAAVVIGIKTWQESSIEKAVQKELSDEATLRKIAAQAQPMLIFDANGGFISDSGGLAYIDRIVIEERDGTFPVKLLVKPKRLLSQPPLLSTIDNILLEYQARRREGMDWEYLIKMRVIQGPGTDSTLCRFRLEVLRNP
ncbi:MAG: hypothetical protein ABSC03_02140 [Verrucomicrobiota bacterium]|jgi:hypothetical protein